MLIPSIVYRSTDETNIPSAEEVNKNKQPGEQIEENIAELDRVTPLNFDKLDEDVKKDGDIRRDKHETGRINDESKEDFDSQRPRHSSETATRNSVTGATDEDSSTEADR